VIVVVLVVLVVVVGYCLDPVITKLNFSLAVCVTGLDFVHYIFDLDFVSIFFLLLIGLRRFANSIN